MKNNLSKLETIEEMIFQSGIKTVHFHFDKTPVKALYVDGVIGLRPGIHFKEKISILAEEYCHAKYNYGNILKDKKQEQIARHKSYEIIAPIKDIQKAIKNGITTSYELSEYLEIPEETLIKILEYYKSKGFSFF